METRIRSVILKIQTRPNIIYFPSWPKQCHSRNMPVQPNELSKSPPRRRGRLIKLPQNTACLFQNSAKKPCGGTLRLPAISTIGHIRLADFCQFDLARKFSAGIAPIARPRRRDLLRPSAAANNRDLPNNAIVCKSLSYFCLLVNSRFRDFAQSIVSQLLLFKRFVEERGRVFETKLFSPIY